MTLSISPSDLSPTDLFDNGLMTSEDWSDDQALSLIEDQLTHYLTHLRPEEQARYLELCREEPRLKYRISETLKGFRSSFESQMQHLLWAAIRKEIKSEHDTDLQRSTLCTRMKGIPPRFPEWSRDPISLISHYHDLYSSDREKRALPEGHEDKLVCKTLWEAAKSNFSFAVVDGLETDKAFLNASYIESRPLPGKTDVSLKVEDFVRAVRAVDIGTRLESELEREMRSSLEKDLGNYQQVICELAMLEAFRRGLLVGDDLIHRQPLLRSLLSTDDTTWKAYRLELGNVYVELPFYVITLKGCAGVFSYFPERPDGAFRQHDSEQDGVASLRDQIRKSAQDNGLGWFHRYISLQNQAKFQERLQQPPLDKSQLNWGALQLYKLFGNDTPQAERITLVQVLRFHPGLAPRSLANDLGAHHVAIVRADITSIARTNRSLDEQQILDSLKDAANFVLELLLTPAPGGVTGLNQLMLTASLGSIAYQTVSAAAALTQGESAEFVQAVGDIADLVITGRLQTVGGHLSAKRTRQLMKDLGRPRKVEGADGSLQLWPRNLSPYTVGGAEWLTGLSADAQGIFHKEGRQYVQVEVGGGTRVAEVVRDTVTDSYQLFHADPKRHRPAVTYSAENRRWVLAAEPTGMLSDTALLKKMLRPDLPSPDPRGLYELQELGGIAREQLDAIWQGRETPSWALADALQRVRLRQALDTVPAQLEKQQLPPPAMGDLVLPALLAIQLKGALRIYAPDRTTLISRHDAVSATGTQAIPDTLLIRKAPGTYCCYADNLSAEADGSIFSSVLRSHEELNPKSTLGRRFDHSMDRLFENRVGHFMSQTAALLRKNLSQVYSALVGERTRSQLLPDAPTYAFAPVQRSDLHESTAVATVRGRYPELSRIAAQSLVQQHPNLASLSSALALEPAAQTALQSVRTRTRVNQALSALMDAHSRGLDNDSEALFCSVLLTQTSWPTKLGIEVYRAVQGVDGGFQKTGGALQTYALDGADHFVSILRGEDKYLGYDALQLDPIPVPVGENSLGGALLRSLTDAQRDAIGYDIFAAGQLADRTVQEALHAREQLSDLLPDPATYLLTPAKLADFAQTLAVKGEQTVSPGVYLVEGKLYVLTFGKTYQVLRDREASSPGREVLRIVRPGDAVANAPDNVYVGTRPGRSEPITLGVNGEWVGASVGGVGGMRRGGRIAQMRAQKNQAEDAAIEELKSGKEAAQKLERELDAMAAALLTAPSRQPSGALQAYRLKTAQLLAQLDKVTAAYERHRSVFADKFKQFNDELGGLMLSSVSHFNRLMASSEIELKEKVAGLASDPLVNPLQYRQFCRHTIATVNAKAPLADRKSLVMSRFDALPLDSAFKDRMEKVNENSEFTPDHLKVALVHFRTSLLSIGDPVSFDGPIVFTPIPTQLSTRFREAAITLDEVALMPVAVQAPVLNNLLEQYAVLRARFENMVETFPAGNEAEHREKIVDIIQHFEKRCETRLEELHRVASDNTELSTTFDDIDMDFLPATVLGSRKTLESGPKKLIKVKQRRRFAIKLGQERVNSLGERVVDIVDPSSIKPEVIQTYAKRGGEWRSITPEPQAPSSGLEAVKKDAQAQLDRVDAHVRKAESGAAANENPTNTLEYLEGKAELMESDAAKLERLTPDNRPAQVVQLVADLRSASARLVTLGERLRLERYKDPDRLDIHRLLYLIEQRQVTVTKITHRERRGKGKEKYFLDVYSIRDAADVNRELWHAHFHYRDAQTPREQFDLKGGHLKTLAQSRLGLGHQIRAQEQGLPHVPIWRADFSTLAAKKLFSLLA